MKSIKVDKNTENSRLDKVLFKVLRYAPSSFVYKMLRKKNIVLNGKKADGKEILKAGDEICIYLSDETYDKFHLGEGKEEGNDYTRAFNSIKDIKVMYECSDFFCVYKPSGVLTQKADKNDLSLNEWCIGYLLNEGAVSDESLETFKPSVLNRLDRNTCGLVLCSKTLKGSVDLSRMIKERQIDKIYKCVVLHDCQLNGVYKCHMVKDEKTNKVSVFDAPVSGSKEMVTGISFIRNISVPGVEEVCSELEIDLITGKTHQIRAHLSHLGFPLIGDSKYGGRTSKPNISALDAQYLCAVRMTFEWNGEKLNIECKTPWG